VKALVKSRPERGLWLDDVPQPTIGINDVLIRVTHTGICGTDLHIYDWDDWAREVIPDDAEFQIWVGADLHNYQIEAVFAQCGRKARLNQGKSQKSYGSSRRSRRR